MDPSALFKKRRVCVDTCAFKARGARRVVGGYVPKKGKDGSVPTAPAPFPTYARRCGRGVEHRGPWEACETCLRAHT